VPTTWFPATATGDTALQRVVELRPEYAAALREVEAAVWGQDLVESRVLELCRRRIAQLLGVDDAPVSADAEAMARDGICLAFAEQLVIDSQGVTDEQAEELISAIGDAGFLVLTYACGFFETTLRAELLLSEGAGL
jgi:hypothetical protein